MSDQEITTLPCPFCAGNNIEIHDLDCDGWIKDIVIVCQNCGAKVETSINRQRYIYRDEREHSFVNEVKFKSDIQAFGLQKWNTRAALAGDIKCSDCGKVIPECDYAIHDCEY